MAAVFCAIAFATTPQLCHNLPHVACKGRFARHTTPHTTIGMWCGWQSDMARNAVWQQVAKNCDFTVLIPSRKKLRVRDHAQGRAEKATLGASRVARRLTVCSMSGMMGA